MGEKSHPILLIEDNPVDVDLARRAFSRYHVTNPFDVVRDGEEALSQISLWDAGLPVPVVILLDLKLPKIDGLEVLRQMKTHEQYRTIPIIVLTSSAEDRDIQTAYQFGANSYIVKPVDFEKFSEVAANINLYWTVLNTLPR